MLNDINRKEQEEIDEYLETGFLTPATGGRKKTEEEEHKETHQIFHQMVRKKGCKFCAQEARQMIEDKRGIYSKEAIEEAKRFIEN